MAFIDIVSCGKNCYLLVDGNAKTAWSEREEVIIFQ